MNSEKGDTYLIGKMEAKLQELMTKEDFTAFILKITKDAFRIESEDMEDGEFKDFVLENFDKITEEPKARDCDNCEFYKEAHVGGFKACSRWKCKEDE